MKSTGHIGTISNWRGIMAAIIVLNGTVKVMADDVTSTWKEGTSVTIPAGEVVHMTRSTPSLDRMTVSGTIIFDTADAVLKAKSVTVEAGGLIKHAGPVTNGQTPARIWIDCSGKLTVAKGGRISADGCGFAGGVGQAKHDDPTSAGHGPGAGGYPKFWGPSPGGSYGGKGGSPSAKNVYGKAGQPDEAGSGGGGGNGIGGGAGGGIIRIQAGDLVLEGAISANGANGVGISYGGGGSGGSVWRQCSSITGNGSVRTDGGSGSRYAGGGGGGRIAVQCDPVAQKRAVGAMVLFSALGGCNGLGEYHLITPDAFGEVGTLNFPAGLTPGRVLPNSGMLSDTKPGDASVNPTVSYWMPWRVNQPLVTVKKEIYIKQPRPYAAAIVQRNYAGPKRQMREIQGVEARDDVHTGRSILSSDDNGLTWTPPAAWPDTLRKVSGVEVWEDGGTYNIFYDEKAGVLVDVWLRQIAIGGNYNNFTYYRISSDFGRTWSEPRQLRYEEGADFDPDQPKKPEFLLKNQAYYGINIIRHSNGTLITAVANANAPDDPKNDNRAWKLGSLCFVGTWDAVKKDYVWKAGQRVTTTENVSSRGLMEPIVAELKDGRVLVVWRGSSTATTPGRKWFSLSSDGGLTLTPPAEWKYDDGSSFYSPSSIHQFVRHSVTGKLYWFGNITPQQPNGNAPRFPLVMAEVDEDLAALKKGTVTLVDDRPDSADPNYQLSNFSLYENRDSHDLELFLTTYGQEIGQQNWMNADCWRYFLSFPPKAASI